MMVVSVGNTASVAPEYTSLITAMQQKTIVQLTGAVQHVTSLTRSLFFESTPVNFESTVYDPPSAHSVDIASDLPAADPPSVPDIAPMEASLEDSAVGPDLPPEAPVETTYHLFLEGTIRGKTKLVTNSAYAFQHQKKTTQRNHPLAVYRAPKRPPV